MFPIDKLAMTFDIESSRQEPALNSKASKQELTTSCAKWKLLLVSLVTLCCGVWLLLSVGVPITVELSSSALGEIPVKWHIPPIHPLHHGKVVYLSYKETDGTTMYKRIVTAPCAYGMLLFNIGPARSFEPFAYDVYDDAYAYSSNEGLCVLYPSYTGTQTSDKIMWEPQDPTEQEVDLGDQENKISSRVVIPPKAKDSTKRGGDFLIIRKGNFYNPQYYKQLREYVNSFPPDSNVTALMAEYVPNLSTD
jgi:hypothetical protein